MGLQFTFEEGGYALKGKDIVGARVVDYGVDRLRSKHDEIDPLLKEDDKITAVTEKLREFIARENGDGKVVVHAQTSIKDKLGGLINGLFGRNQEPVASAKRSAAAPASSLPLEKVALAKGYLGRLEALRGEVGRELRRVTSVTVRGMPSQRLDSLEAIQNDAFANRRVSHELGWIVGAKEQVGKAVAVNGPHSTMEAKSVNDRFITSKLKTTAVRPCTKFFRCEPDMGRSLITDESKTGFIAANQPVDLREDDLARLERRNSELTVMSAKLEDKIAQLEESSMLSRFGDFLKGTSVASQISSLKEQKFGVERRCLEIENKIKAIEKARRRVAA